MELEQNRFAYDIPTLSCSASFNSQCIDIDTSPSSFHNEFECIDNMQAMLYRRGSTLSNGDPMNIDDNATSPSGGPDPRGQLTVESKAPQIRYAKPSEWNPYRELISTLYNQMKLPELTAFMEREHNFRASEKMYKDRFRAWGINVKNKKPATRKRRPMQPPRGAISKSYQSNANILQLDPRLLQHYMIEYSQVPRKSLFHSDYDFHQRILKAVRHFYVGSFENGNWILIRDSIQLPSRKKSKEYNSHSNTLFNMCTLATDEFESGNTVEAERLLIIALAPLSNIAKATKALFLTQLIAQLQRLISCNFLWVARKILTQVVGIFTAVHGPAHPLVMLLSWMQQVECRLYMLEVIKESVSDLVDEFAGSMNELSLRLRMIRFLTLRNRDACDAIGRIVRECESKLSLDDRRTATARRYYIRALRSLGDQDTAIKQCHRGYVATVAMKVTKAADIRSRLCISLACLYENDVLKSVHYLEEAIHLLGLCKSHTGSRLIRSYDGLESLHRRRGNVKAMEKFRNARLTILNRAYDAALV